ncbi:MAG: DUF2953 domain-containing protein [Paenibacillaceae bacterium]
MVWVWIVLIVIVLIVVVALSGVRTHIIYTRESQDDQFNMEIRALYGIFRYRYSIPVIQFEGLLKGFSVEKESSTNIPMPASKDHNNKDQINIDRKVILNWYEKGKVLIHHVIGFNHWLMSTLKHTHCTQLSWVTNVGLDDAAETAITTGMIWGLKTSILGVFFNQIKLEAQPQLAVVPQFNQTMFRTHFDCSLMIRMGYAFFAGLQLFVRIYKVKGGIRTWQKSLSKS